MSQRRVVLYRMKLPEHECPYGLRARQMLEGAGIPFEERLLTSRDEVDAFEDEHEVDTTPQVFVDGERIGGSEELASWLETSAA
ncbi:MAG TPA: glutaredoxin domain-containing protein [Sphingomicrobium sp.]|nr:glutaredoxin domain-containing protein [Sphingomicrobium sp.]